LIFHLYFLQSGERQLIKWFFKIKPKLIPNSYLNLYIYGPKTHLYNQVRLSDRRTPKNARSGNMSTNARSLKYLLGWLIAGTRGGPTRAKIILALRESPQNANQLATLLKMDYKTMRHHLEVLEKNKIITSVGDRYGATYFLSQVMEDNYSEFDEIMKKIGKK